MISERILVENNILYNQNEIVNELVKARVIAEDTFFDAVGEEEVLEWWLVTPQFARMLKAENEVILTEFDNHWWGRTTSGQAIYIDGVITDIAKQLN